MPPPKILTPEQTQQILDLYAAGKSMAEIGRTVTLSQALVKRTLEAAGVLRNWFPDRREQEAIVELYTTDPTANIRSVARTVGRDASTVRRVLHNRSIPLRHRASHTPEQDAAAVALYRSGLDIRAVAAATGRSYGVIQKLVAGARAARPHNAASRGPHGKFRSAGPA